MPLVDIKTLDELARKLAEAVPTGLTELQQDMERNLRAGLEDVFQRLDLVTREEYDVQVALLARCRAKLQALERRVEELEKASGGSHSKAPQGESS